MTFPDNPDKEQSRREQQWRILEEKYERGEWLQASVTDRDNDGLIVDVDGIRGHVPYTAIISIDSYTLDHFDGSPLFLTVLPTELREAVEKIRGSTLRLRITQINRARNLLALSERTSDQDWITQQFEKHSLPVARSDEGRYTMQESAKVLGVSNKTLVNWIERDGLRETVNVQVFDHDRRAHYLTYSQLKKMAEDHRRSDIFAAGITMNRVDRQFENSLNRNRSEQPVPEETSQGLTPEEVATLRALLEKMEKK